MPHYLMHFQGTNAQRENHDVQEPMEQKIQVPLPNNIPTIPKAGRVSTPVGLKNNSVYDAF